MRKLRKPLDKLLKADRKFTCAVEYDMCFTTFKLIVQSDLILRQCNRNSEYNCQRMYRRYSRDKFPDWSLRLVQLASTNAVGLRMMSHVYSDITVMSVVELCVGA